MQKIDRVGEVKLNKHGNKMTIIIYNDANNITVEFENGYITNSKYDHFQDGNIKSPYDKSIFNIGYIGEGIYKPKESNGMCIQYKYWVNMLKRCYYEESLKKDVTYKDKYVCEEWYCFQTFAKWFDENYYECNDGYVMDLDKDILCKGNKVYSPDTCVFVSHRINTLFLKRQNDRGDYPIGVNYDKRRDKFRARCCMLNGRKDLGLFNTPEDAFYEGYKPFKETYIKEVANEYKSKIPLSLYDAMINYKVEIDD